MREPVKIVVGTGVGTPWVFLAGYVERLRNVIYVGCIGGDVGF